MESITHAMGTAMSSICEAVTGSACSFEQDLDEAEQSLFIPGAQKQVFIPENFAAEQQAPRRSSMIELHSRPQSAFHVQPLRARRRYSVPDLNIADAAKPEKEENDGYYHHEEDYSWEEHAKELQKFRKKIHHELTPGEKWFLRRKHQHELAGKPASHEQ
eukprot:2783613-Rhodomonas_salina.2